jgi:ATP-dependent DNA helicase DinG
MTNTEQNREVTAHAWVDAAYAKLEQTSGITIRPQQVELSKDIVTATLNRTAMVAEAPTGTGKTLAYLLGAIAAHPAMGAGGHEEPIVVSTATKALQQQLMKQDLPKLIQAGLLTADQIGIAKGKGNYICRMHAHDTLSLLHRAGQDSELFVDDESAQFSYEDLSDMMKALDSEKWNGDFDEYEGSRPLSIRGIAVKSETCARKKCEHYKDCAFYATRNRLSTCKVVVANHDLLLLDLLLVSQEIEPTLPLANYQVVFDEAHHLPEKAIKVGSADGGVTHLMNTLPKLMGIEKLMKGSPELTRVLASKGVKVEQLDKGNILGLLRELVDALSMEEVDEDSSLKRFPRGVIPEKVSVLLDELKEPLQNLLKGTDGFLSTIREAEGLSAPVAEKASEVVRRALDVRAPVNGMLECIALLRSPARYAKWMYRKEGIVSLHGAPLEGADVLKRLLWQSNRTKAVTMVSATLRDLGGFSRFTQTAGLPSNTRFKVLPYLFPYGESEIVVPAMAASPKMAERKQFLPELASKLPRAIKREEGTLVLFPSWAMLREFGPKLKSRFGDQAVKIQGEKPPAMLVKAHCRDIDAGKGSMLLGVATLSEGLDLPGKYCTHVVIIALPFSVPTDPVEQEIAEYLGSKYFEQRSLPDAMTRLTQMVGRLLRRESDRGRVTLFDRRLVSTSYGKRMLKSLPPFKQVIETTV